MDSVTEPICACMCVWGGGEGGGERESDDSYIAICVYVWGEEERGGEKAPRYGGSYHVIGLG